MREDVVLELLKQVKSGKVSIDDARTALEGVELSEETYLSAVDHGVFNEPTPGTVVRSSISPAGDSIIIIISGNDINYINNHGNSISKVRNA